MVASDRLAAALAGRHDWSEAGAAAVVALATDYGAFMLRNALALAVAQAPRPNAPPERGR